MDYKEFLEGVRDNSLRLSFSSLSKILKSPWHFRHYFCRQRDKPTPQMQFGSLVHTLILEPEQYPLRYALTPKLDRRTKAGKAQYKEFLESLTDDIAVIDQKTYDDARRAVDGFMENKRAVELLNHAEHVEQELSFEHKNLTIKGIRDIAHSDYVCDLKTTADSSPRGFRFSVYKYLYHMQAAIYTYDTDRDYFFIALEKTGCCQVYQLSETLLDEGRTLFEDAVIQYHSSRFTENWNEGWGHKEVDKVIVL